jgi:hypothetical protein
MAGLPALALERPVPAADEDQHACRADTGMNLNEPNHRAVKAKPCLDSPSEASGQRPKKPTSGGSDEL